MDQADTQPQQEHVDPGVAAANAAACPSVPEQAPGAPGPSTEQLESPDTVSKQLSSVQRMKVALDSVLASNLSSDFIEGLKPVIQDAKLQVATYIPLQGEDEPAFIGSFPSIQAAVHAQKQSYALVGKLPGAIARKLIEAQLANALAASPAAGVEATLDDAAGADTCAASDKYAPVEAAEVTACNKPPSPTIPATAAAEHLSGTEGTVAQQVEQHQQEQQQEAKQQQQQAAVAEEQQVQVQETVLQRSELPGTVPTGAASGAQAAAAAEENGPSTQAVEQQSIIESNTSAAVGTTSTVAPAVDEQPTVLGAAAAAAAPTETAAAPVSAAGEPQDSSAPAVEEANPASDVAAAQPLSALTDDVINLLLRKGLHALSAVAQNKEGDQGDGAQQQQSQAAVDEPPGQDVSNAAALALTGIDSSLYSQGQLSALATGEQPYQQQLQGYSVAAAYNMGISAGLPSMPAASTAATAATGASLDAPLMVDGMLEYTMPHTGLYKGPGQGQASSSGLPPRPALHEPWGAAGAAPGAGLAGVAAGAAMAAAYPAGFPAGAFPAGVFPQDSFGLPLPQGMPDMYGRRPRLSGTASDSNSYGGYPQQWADFNPGMFGAVAAAQPANSGDKRKRSDPRLNCIKSVQYRVSRFPAELHDMCIEHWERTRCARVVCNGVNGVMSVQGGRCVVSFTQHGQEVLKGVADFLRYAGEDRIKKWRRHVRMVDFPRPNNRTGELMTAEEFLCIVGYQSEQGGGKRPKYMSGAAAEVMDAGGDVSE